MQGIIKLDERRPHHRLLRAPLPLSPRPPEDQRARGAEVAIALLRRSLQHGHVLPAAQAEEEAPWRFEVLCGGGDAWKTEFLDEIVELAYNSTGAQESTLN